MPNLVKIGLWVTKTPQLAPGCEHIRTPLTKAFEIFGDFSSVLRRLGQRNDHIEDTDCEMLTLLISKW